MSDFCRGGIKNGESRKPFSVFVFFKDRTDVERVPVPFEKRLCLEKAKGKLPS